MGVSISVLLYSVSVTVYNIVRRVHWIIPANVDTDDMIDAHYTCIMPNTIPHMFVILIILLILINNNNC